jgi:hypothetical protein
MIGANGPAAANFEQLAAPIGAATGASGMSAAIFQQLAAQHVRQQGQHLAAAAQAAPDMAGL